MNYNLILNDILNNPVFSHCDSLYESTCSDIEKQDDKYVFRSKAIGLENNDINIDIKDSILEIKTNDEKKGKWITSINKKIKVGSKIDVNGISANLKNGVLEVIMPLKEEHSITRKIEVL